LLLEKSAVSKQVNSSSSKNEYYLGGIMALLLQDHCTMSIKSVLQWRMIYTSLHDLYSAKVLEESGRVRGQRYSRHGGQLKGGRLTESKMSLDDV